jgi:NADH:ubiquinone oxidoreductase subunit D
MGTERKSLVGYGILLLAFIGLIALVIVYYDGQDQVQTLESAIDHQLNLLSHHQSGKPKQSPEDLRKMEELKKSHVAIKAELDLPWGELFSELEQAKVEDVAVLELEPDPKQNKIKISAEAKSFKGMLDYVRALSGRKRINGVYLLNHKIDEQNPLRPIRFTVEASWILK